MVLLVAAPFVKQHPRQRHSQKELELAQRKWDAKQVRGQKYLNQMANAQVRKPRSSAHLSGFFFGLLYSLGLILHPFGTFCIFFLLSNGVFSCA